jgi:cell division septum initiation protein DivIVA
MSKAPPPEPWDEAWKQVEACDKTIAELHEAHAVVCAESQRLHQAIHEAYDEKDKAWERFAKIRFGY